MKKILLATTAAVCVGGVASAEVSLSGEGKLGLKYSKSEGEKTEVGTISSANVKFTLSGETDNEMIGEFGASFTLDANEALNSDGNLDNPYVVYVGSADGPLGKFEAGSDLGAADKKSGGLGDPGLDGLGIDNIAEAYYGGSGKTLRYEKSIAGAAIALSLDLDDAWAIGGEYAVTDQLTIGAGYDQNEVARATATEGFNEQNTMSFGVIGSMNQFSAGFLYSSRSTTVPTGQPAVADQAAYGVEVGYEIGATKFTAHFAQNDNGTPALPERGWGVGMSHDLGGGLSLKAGFANAPVTNEEGTRLATTKANFGFLMAF